MVSKYCGRWEVMWNKVFWKWENLIPDAFDHNVVRKVPLFIHRFFLPSFMRKVILSGKIHYTYDTAINRNSVVDWTFYIFLLLAEARRFHNRKDRGLASFFFGSVWWLHLQIFVKKIKYFFEATSFGNILAKQISFRNIVW